MAVLIELFQRKVFIWNESGATHRLCALKPLDRHQSLSSLIAPPSLFLGVLTGAILSLVPNVEIAFLLLLTLCFAECDITHDAGFPVELYISQT